jgi:hypothetical protein
LFREQFVEAKDFQRDSVNAILNRNLFIAYAALLSLFLAAVCAHGQRYIEISAEIELVTYQSGSTNGAVDTKPRTISVVCVAGTNEWRIEHDFAQGAEVKWLFDGTNIYHSLRRTKPTPADTTERVLRNIKLATVPFEAAKSNLTINVHPSAEGVPLGDVGVNIPWLAFCSGTYLKRAGRLVPLPVEILRHTRDRFAYSDKTKVFADGFGLPRSIDLFTSKSLYETSNADFDKEYFFGDRYAEHTKRVAAGLEDGVLTFRYAVTESTNFLGWNFPTKFEFFQNARKYEQNGDWFGRGVGRLTSIRAGSKPQNLFVPAMQQTIVDWRFRDAAARVNAITYTSTNSFVAPTNDPALQSKFQATVVRARK